MTGVIAIILDGEEVLNYSGVAGVDLCNEKNCIICECLFCRRAELCKRTIDNDRA